MLKPHEVKLLARDDEKPLPAEVIQAVDDVLKAPWEPYELNRCVWVTNKPSSTPRRVAEAYQKAGWSVYISRKDLAYGSTMLTFHRPVHNGEANASDHAKPYTPHQAIDPAAMRVLGQLSAVDILAYLTRRLAHPTASAPHIAQIRLAVDHIDSARHAMQMGERVLRDALAKDAMAKQKPE